MTKNPALPAEAIEAKYRREASRLGAGFQAKPQDVARGLVGPHILPTGFQGVARRLGKAMRRRKRC